MYRTIAIAAVALALAGCSTFNGPASYSKPITVYYEAADGSVKTRPLYLPGSGSIGPASNSSGIFSDGHMAAPEPGKAWWD